MNLKSLRNALTLFTLIIATSFLFSFDLNAQNKKPELQYSGFFDSYYFRGPWAFTLGAGIANYNGDLAKMYNFTQINPALMIGANYKLWPRTTFGAEFTYFQIQARDTDSTRNLSFSSTNFELNAFARFNLVEDIVRVAADRGRKPKKVKPYIQLGIGGVLFNPTSQHFAPPTDTSFLISEGMVYPRVAFLIPVGFGFSFWMSHRVQILADLNYKYVFSDLLDDVKLRTKESGNDSYAILSLKLQYAPFAPKLKKKKKYKGQTPDSGGGGGDGTDGTSTPSGDAPKAPESKPETPETAPAETPEEQQIEKQIEETAPEEGTLEQTN